MTDLRDREQSLYDAAENAFNSEGGFIAPATPNPVRATKAAVALVTPIETAALEPINQTPLSSEKALAQKARERIMEEASVTSDGRHYYYDGYRYDGLVDAVDQSVLMHSQPLHAHQPGPFVNTPPVSVRTDADLVLMIALGISFVRGQYCFKDFRYDHLADAVSYARTR
jgi:hypothetical protein